MANKIVKDSMLPIFVKAIDVPQATLPNALVARGAIRGLAGDYPRLGADGLYWVTVDTAAEIRVSSVAIAFTVGAPVYVTSGNVISGTSTGNFLLGYATHAKGAPSGDLWVQLVPSASTTALA